jgi:hypothetical protein
VYIIIEIGEYDILHMFIIFGKRRVFSYYKLLSHDTFFKSGALFVGIQQVLTPESTFANTVEPLTTDTAGEFKFCPL